MKLLSTHKQLSGSVYVYVNKNLSVTGGVTEGKKENHRTVQIYQDCGNMHSIYNLTVTYYISC